MKKMLQGQKTQHNPFNIFKLNDPYIPNWFVSSIDTLKIF